MPLRLTSRSSRACVSPGNAIGTAMIALAWVAISAHAGAQPAAKVRTIGWLSQNAAPGKDAARAEDLQRSLRDLGYAEGRNLRIEYRYANGDLARLDALADELVRLAVEVLVTSGEPAAVAAKRATQSIPIVATEMTADPVKSGLVASLARPGGNVTGVATEELWPKRLALLRELVPSVSTVAVLWNPANAANAACKQQIGAAAPALNLQLRDLEVRDPGAVDSALAALVKDLPHALVACWDGVTLAKAKTIARFALEHRLATLAPLTDYVEAGVLLSLGTSLSTQRRGAARYVSRILSGSAPGDLPVENAQPKLVINEKTLQSLRLPLPVSFQVRIDEVL